MSIDKAVDSTQLNADLTSVANAIRTKGGTSAQLAFPNGFVSAIGDIPTGGTLITKTITANGTYEASDDDADGYSEVTVNVSGGGSGGLDNIVNVNDPELEIPYMLSAIKNGNVVSGTCIFTSAFPNNSETLLISTGLSVVHGFLFSLTDASIVENLGNGQTGKHVAFFGRSFTDYPSNALTSIGFGIQNGAVVGRSDQAFGTRVDASCVQGILRIDSGDIYYTARYNKNLAYQVILPNKTYEWIAW